MKCVTDGSVVTRVTDKEAAELVKHGWAYCAKYLWKKVVRGK